MTPRQLLLEGVELMLFGMGSVFVFLVLLILAIRLMAWLIERFGLAGPLQPAVASLPANVPAAGPEPDVLAAIQLAIHQHRARRG
jgi:oxaloacetate decarboxylase gamma subunit